MGGARDRAAVVLVLACVAVAATAGAAPAEVTRTVAGQRTLAAGQSRVLRLHDDRAVAVVVVARAARCRGEGHRRARLLVRIDSRRSRPVHVSSRRWRRVRVAASGVGRVRLMARRVRRGACTGVAVRRVGLVQPLPTTAPGPVRPSTGVPLGSAVPTDISDRLADVWLHDTFLRAFDGLTPENAMKMEVVQPRRGRFDFDEVDRLIGWALRHGKTVRGHPLVWHGQLPRWLRERDWSREELTEILRHHVQTLVLRYRGRVQEWDVVNEPLADDGSWRENLWYRVIGPEYVELALRWAHEVDPQARLYVNEYDVEVGGPPKAEAFVRLLAGLRAGGVPVHGAGLQTHWSLSRLPGTGGDVEAMLRRLAALGLEVQITEMDLTLGDVGSLEEQAAVFAAVAAACRAVAACRRFTTWGVSDRYSWRGRHQRPVLFDDQYRPKPAYGAVRAALAGG